MKRHCNGVKSVFEASDIAFQSNANYAWEAMRDMEFQVEANMWHHPSSDLADILLPAQV